MHKSILVDCLDWCYVCGRPRQAIHHVFYGTANRKISDKEGFIVPLCNDCNTGPHGVHFNRELDLELKRLCEKKYLENHRLAEFMDLIGRNYL